MLKKCLTAPKNIADDPKETSAESLVEIKSSTNIQCKNLLSSIGTNIICIWIGFWVLLLGDDTPKNEPFVVVSS